MIKNIILSILLLTIVSCKETETPISIATSLVKAEMQRTPNSVNLDFLDIPKWNYAAGVELLGIEQLAKAISDSQMMAYTYSFADSFVMADGTIRGYKAEEYNIDRVNSGKLLIELYKSTNEERFLKAASALRSQMYTHPRTLEGGWWHKKVYEHQMWLDGLYMGAPFVAQYDALCAADTADFADIVKQFLIVGRHTFDPSTKLYRHAWDETHSQFWADTITGQSQHAWGRANGWYFMAMADVLPLIPPTTIGRDTLLTRFADLAEALLSVRDSATGMWFQVLDSPYKKGNYVESSCSAMFIYGMLKGVANGLLNIEYEKIAQEAYWQFVDNFVDVDENGLTCVKQCCAVAGLGGKEIRDGSYDYYINEKIRCNDPKTIGPFVMASVLMNKK